MRRVRDEILAALGKKTEASEEENPTFRNQEVLNCLAKQLDVAPGKLLSHVLDYRLSLF